MQRALVVLEVRQGLVTSNGARDYGVVLATDGSADEAATASLREQIKAGRGELPLFDYGPSLEELRANCEAETGLPAPTQPVWNTHPALAEAAE